MSLVLTRQGENRQREKRRRVLDAARVLFLAHGLKGTTMEAIARQARIAKPTLYGQFPDKDAVFVAILEQLLADKLAAFEAGIAGDAPIAARLSAALAAEFGVVGDALAGSPHAEELFAAHRHAATLFKASDDLVYRRLVAELEAAGRGDAPMLARLVLDASFGLAQKSIGRRDLAVDIAFLVEKLLG